MFKMSQKLKIKMRGEKTKKQVAKKSEDGSIAFKNQDELDGFIRIIYRVHKKNRNDTNCRVLVLCCFR